MYRMQEQIPWHGRFPICIAINPPLDTFIPKKALDETSPRDITIIFTWSILQVNQHTINHRRIRTAVHDLLVSIFLPLSPYLMLAES